MMYTQDSDIIKFYREVILEYERDDKQSYYDDTSNDQPPINYSEKEQADNEISDETDSEKKEEILNGMTQLEKALVNFKNNEIDKKVSQKDLNNLVVTLNKEDKRYSIENGEGPPNVINDPILELLPNNSFIGAVLLYEYNDSNNRKCALNILRWWRKKRRSIIFKNLKNPEDEEDRNKVDKLLKFVEGKDENGNKIDITYKKKKLDAIRNNKELRKDYYRRLDWDGIISDIIQGILKSKDLRECYVSILDEWINKNNEYDWKKDQNVRDAIRKIKGFSEDYVNKQLKYIKFFKKIFNEIPDKYYKAKTIAYIVSSIASVILLFSVYPETINNLIQLGKHTASMSMSPEEILYTLNKIFNFPLDIPDPSSVPKDMPEIQNISDTTSSNNGSTPSETKTNTNEEFLTEKDQIRYYVNILNG